MHGSRLPVLFRRTWQAVFLVVLALMATGCARYAIIDYDRDARFDQYRSYALENLDSDAEVQSLDANRMEGALRKHLSAQGLREATEPDAADVVMRYAIKDEKRTESRGPSVGVGFGFGRSPFGFGLAHSPVSTREIREGKLVIQMVDTSNQRVIWQGTGQRNLRENMEPQERTELIDRIIGEMFENYPPR